MKKCIKCNITKSISEFPIRNTGIPRGECKACTAAWAKQYRKKNKYIIKLQAARTSYNITIEEAEELYSQTHCEICNKEVKGKNKHIDHCHTTGAIRGILCNRCNLALGYFKDDIEILKKAIKYLKASKLYPINLQNKK